MLTWHGGPLANDTDRGPGAFPADLWDEQGPGPDADVEPEEDVDLSGVSPVGLETLCVGYSVQNEHVFRVGFPQRI